MADNGRQRARGNVAAKEDSKQTPGRTQGGHMVETWESGLKTNTERAGAGWRQSGHKADAWLMQGGHMAENVWRRGQSGLKTDTAHKRGVFSVIYRRFLCNFRYLPRGKDISDICSEATHLQVSPILCFIQTGSLKNPGV